MLLLDRAIKMAAEQDEPDEMNFVRKHAKQQAAEMGMSLRDAATRVFSNSSGSYSSNVNLAVENSSWSDEQQLQVRAACWLACAAMWGSSCAVIDICVAAVCMSGCSLHVWLHTDAQAKGTCLYCSGAVFAVFNPVHLVTPPPALLMPPTGDVPEAQVIRLQQ